MNENEMEPILSKWDNSYIVRIDGNSINANDLKCRLKQLIYSNEVLSKLAKVNPFYSEERATGAIYSLERLLKELFPEPKKEETQQATILPSGARMEL